MRRTMVTVLGVIAMAQPAWSQSSAMTSTYTPGTPGSDGFYVSRHAAATHTPNARGGGPSSTPTVDRVTRVRHHGALSDNQTRRAGAVNYTGASFKPSDERSAHTQSSGGASLSESHTGSRTTGRIAVRAPASNEESTRPAPSARGGGPSDADPGSVLLDGDRVQLAMSGPIAWLAPEPKGIKRLSGPRLSSEDLAMLPLRVEPVNATRSDGLLAMRSRVAPSALLDGGEYVASQPQTVRIGATAIGGGPVALDDTTPGMRRVPIE